MGEMFKKPIFEVGGTALFWHEASQLEQAIKICVNFICKNT